MLTPEKTKSTVSESCQQQKKDNVNIFILVFILHATELRIQFKQNPPHVFMNAINKAE